VALRYVEDIPQIAISVVFMAFLGKFEGACAAARDPFSVALCTAANAVSLMSPPPSSKTAAAFAFVNMLSSVLLMGWHVLTDLRVELARAVKSCLARRRDGAPPPAAEPHASAEELAQSLRSKRRLAYVMLGLPWMLLVVQGALASASDCAPRAPPAIARHRGRPIAPLLVHQLKLSAQALNSNPKL
jgi:hypothetical protein